MPMSGFGPPAAKMPRDGSICNLTPTGFDSQSHAMSTSLTSVLLSVVVMLLAVDASAQTAPSILTQPTSQISAQGGPVTFSVTATGTLPLSYQWRKEGTNITGSTAANYTIAAAMTNHAGNY